MSAHGQEFFSNWADSNSLFAGAGVTILMYHGIARPPLGSRHRALFVAPGFFRRQMAWLRAAGLDAVPLDDAVKVARAGGRGFCVTFDDGFTSVFTNALAVLKDQRVRATQFLVAGLIGRTNRWDTGAGGRAQSLMDEGQVRGWLAAGQDIGSHTVNHSCLTKIHPARARAEIFDSKKMIEDRFGVAVRHFCYPYGDFDERTRDCVAEAGYETACTTSLDTVRSDLSDCLRLPRIMARHRPPGIIWSGIGKMARRLTRTR